MESAYKEIVEAQRAEEGFQALAEDCKDLVTEMAAVSGEEFNRVSIGLLTALVKALRKRKITNQQLTMALTGGDEAAERAIFQDLAVAIQERGSCLNTLLK